MRLFLIIIFAICSSSSTVTTASAGDQTVTRIRTVESAQEAFIARHAQWNRACKSLEVPIIKIDAPPKHGKIRGDVVHFKPMRSIPGSRYTQCLGTEMTGAALLYTANPNFDGQDEVAYTAIFTKRRNGAQKEFKHRVVINVVPPSVQNVASAQSAAPAKAQSAKNIEPKSIPQPAPIKADPAAQTPQTPPPAPATNVAVKSAPSPSPAATSAPTKAEASAQAQTLAPASAAQIESLTKAQSNLEKKQHNLQAAQARSDTDVQRLSAALGGIVLPVWEKPAEWMMRVSAVPVQQQQFCRIIDSFYDRLADVYKTQNEIKRNALFRDRKQDLATLLPGGQFENWVVQVVEVKQASDGSAAVMLQPPCRAMLGSDACQRKGSEIRATIPQQSPTYRELERVSSGDFVVVSGKILYADSSRFNEPLPTYAVYEPGSHCSDSVKDRNADVFVTDIRYLVQLR